MLGQGVPAQPMALQPQPQMAATPLGVAGPMAPQQFYFPQQLGFQQPFYPGYGFPPQNFGQEDEDSWEVETVASSQAVARQDVHELSDDDESVGAGPERPEIDLSKVKTGKLAALLKAQHDKVKDEDRVGPKVHAVLAATLNDLFEETKAVTEVEKLAKEYPRVENLEKQVVPRLDSEIFMAVDQATRTADVGLQALQKGVIAAISAMAPIGSLMLERGEDDTELDTLSSNMADGMKLVALTAGGLSQRRRDILRPKMDLTYAKALGKVSGGSPKWLFGGNLSEETRKCEAAKRLAEKIVKRKTPQSQGNGQGKGFQGQHQQKKFKQPNKQNWQSWQQFPTTPKVFSYQYQQPHAQQGQQQFHYQNFQNFQNQSYRQKGPKQQGGAPGQPGGQDFQKRGAQKQ